MNTQRISLLIVSFFLIVATTANGTTNKKPIVDKAYKLGLFNQIMLKSFTLNKKSYYTTIFTKDERKQLRKADKYLASAKKYLAQYNSYQADIDKQYKIAEATGNSKSMNKALKKAEKLKSKALKKGSKAMKYYEKAFSIRSRIYSTAINRTRLNDNSKNANSGRELELRATTLFNEALKKSGGSFSDEQQKVDALISVNELRIHAFKLQEVAFGAYANDKKLNTDDYLGIDTISVDTNTAISADTNFFPKYVEQYNPLADVNLYKTKANLILPRINLTNVERKQIVDANKKNKSANNLMKQVDKDYAVVDSLNMLAETQFDLRLKDKMKQLAIEKEQKAFYKLLKATNIYLEANEIRYNVYKNHFVEVRPKTKTMNSERAAVLERDANEYFAKAKSIIRASRNLMYKSDQYIKLMGANDYQLYSLQLQESAYGLYLGIPDAISDRVDVDFVNTNTYNDDKTSTDKNNTSSKLSWKVLASYTYSVTKPKPTKYKIEKGVVFHIQLGIYKGLLPPKKFAKVSPIMYDKFVDNPYRRYLVGKYYSSEGAEAALAYVKNMGYDDAYIISKVNGYRKTYSFGKAKLVFNDKYIRHKVHELVIFDDITPPDGIKNGDNRNVKNTKGLVYFVQLGMYIKPISSNDFNNIEPIFTEKIPGKGTRYMTGMYQTIAMARSAEKTIKRNGFPDAYVVAYNNGANIALTRARQIEKKSGVGSNYQTNNTRKVKFCVQVGAYKNKLNDAEYQKLARNFAPRKVEIKYSGGMNIYAIGNYKSYSEAKYLSNKLQSLGHDCFIVAFKGSVKISLGDAIKQSKK
ncbi:MAG: hypothetical protein B6I20_00965 [Bacteroidetes bacterium 4572_117]|nr:MAG: hypothetical protein B6I20_00965 [Bacteroidetes bacterium 4572_117]